MQRLRNSASALRKNSRKGFTLVEIIVVIVIIAILLAALTPAVIGWIQEARDRALIAEGRTGLVAAQALIVDRTGRGEELPASVTTGTALIEGVAPDGTGGTYTTMGGQNFGQLIGSTLNANSYFNITYTANGDVTTISYQVYNDTTGVRGGRIAVWEASGENAGWRVINPS